MPNKNNRKGFTLIEVLVAVLIVGILASIAMPLYQKVVLKSRAAEAVNLLEMVKERQTAAISQNKTYIAKAADLQPLTTNSPEAPSGDDLYVNSNYKVVLNTQKECAVVSYIQNGQEQFSFASSYNRSGLGCDGEICSGFDGVTANVESVCTIPVQQTACTVTQCENRQFFSISDCSCKNCAPCPEGTVEYGSGCACVTPTPECNLDCDTSNTGRILNTENGACECICPPGSYWNGSKCDKPSGCEGLSCPPPLVMNSDCECDCPSNKPLKVRDDDGNIVKCLDCGDVCGDTFNFVLNSDNTGCIADCPSEQIWNEDTQTCLPCSEIDSTKPFYQTGETQTAYWHGYTYSTSSPSCEIHYSGSCSPCGEEPCIEECTDPTKPLLLNNECYSCADTANNTELGNLYGVGYLYHDGHCYTCPDTLTNSGLAGHYGQGPVLLNANNPEQYKCGSCVEAKGESAPVWNGHSCVSCALAYPAKVVCPQGGVASLPRRNAQTFSDYLAAYNAENMDSYALKSGALVAAAGHTTSTTGDIIGGTIVVGLDEGGTLIPPGGGNGGGGNTGGGGGPAPYCGQYRYNTGNISYTIPTTDIRNVTNPAILAGVTFGTQGNCTDSYHGAVNYEPIRPVWDSTKQACVTCAEYKNVSTVVKQCTGSENADGDETISDTFMGAYWNGSYCVVNRDRIGEYDTGEVIYAGTGYVSGASYQMPQCKYSVKMTFRIQTQYSSGGTCKSTWWYNPKVKETNGASYKYPTLYQEYQNHNAGQLAKIFWNGYTYTSLLNTAINAANANDTYSEEKAPYDKGYYALTKLGLSPNAINSNTVKLSYGTTTNDNYDTQDTAR